VPVGLRPRLFEGDGRVGDVQGSKDASTLGTMGPTTLSEYNTSVHDNIMVLRIDLTK